MDPYYNWFSYPRFSNFVRLLTVSSFVLYLGYENENDNGLIFQCTDKPHS